MQRLLIKRSNDKKDVEHVVTAVSPRGVGYPVFPFTDVLVACGVAKSSSYRARSKAVELGHLTYEDLEYAGNSWVIPLPALRKFMDIILGAKGKVAHKALRYVTSYRFEGVKPHDTLFDPKGSTVVAEPTGGPRLLHNSGNPLPKAEFDPDCSRLIRDILAFDEKLNGTGMRIAWTNYHDDVRGSVEIEYGDMEDGTLIMPKTSDLERLLGVTAGKLASIIHLYAIQGVIVDGHHFVLSGVKKPRIRLTPKGFYAILRSRHTKRALGHKEITIYTR